MPVRLSRAAAAGLRLHRPGARPRAARRRASGPGGPSEAELLRQVLGWLALRGHFFWRANAGGGVRRGRPVRGNLAGTPDVLVALPPDGRRLGIELKTAAGRLRPSQIAWRAAALRVGVRVVVVRSLDALVALFDRLEGKGGVP